MSNIALCVVLGSAFLPSLAMLALWLLS